MKTALAVVLCLVFLATGLAKLTSQPMIVAEFATLGLPTWFMLLTGVLELLGAVLVVIPATARAGSTLLICIGAGAIVAHLTHGQAVMAFLPLVLLALAAWLLRLRGGFSIPFFTASARG